MKTKMIWTLMLLLAMGAFLAVATPAVAQEGDGDTTVELKTCPMCGSESAFEGRVCDHCAEAMAARRAEGGRGMREHECTGEDCVVCKRMEDMRNAMAERGEGKQCEMPEWKPRGLTDEQKAELTTYLEGKFPETLKQLNEVKAEDESKGARGEMMLFFAYKKTQELPDDLQDVAFGNMLGKFKIMQLAKQYKDATDDETKDALKAELKELLDANFDGDQKLKAYHLDQMEARLKEAREKVAERTGKKDEVVAEQLEDILSGKHPRMPEHECKGDDCEEGKRMKAGHGMMMPGCGEGMKPMREHECSGDDCEKCKRMKAGHGMMMPGCGDEDGGKDADEDGGARTYATPKTDDED